MCHHAELRCRRRGRPGSDRAGVILSKGPVSMTKAFLRCLVGGVLTALAFSQPVRADAPKPATTKPHTYAVLVGISQYADKQIKPRPNAEADAKALYELATNKDYLGADAADVKLLL